MLDKENLLIKTQIEKEYSERQVMQSIDTIRRILDRVEKGVLNGSPNADDGLQGNEWKLYKELSNLEKLTEFIDALNKL